MNSLKLTEKPSFGAQIKIRLSKLFSHPSLVIGSFLVMVLSYLVLAPIVSILSNSIRLTRMDAILSGGKFGDFTYKYIYRVFLSPISENIFWTPLLNSLTVSFFATLIALMLGLILASLVTSTNILGRKYLGFLLIIPYMLPSQAMATAWITLFKNRKISGPLGMLEAFGINPPDWLAYGPLPISVCMALSYFPFAFLLFSSALNKIDFQLEEVATTLGAKSIAVWSKIIMPLLIPTTMSVLLLTVARTLGTFATPYILGTPARYTLLSTSLYSSVRSNESGVVAVLAIVLSFIGIMLLLVDISVVKKWQRFVTVGGKGIKRQPSKLGVLRVPTTIFAWIIFLVAAFGPFIVLALSTLMRESGNFAISNFGLAYWTGIDVPGMDQPGIFTSPEVIIALRNSLLIAGSASIICGFLGLIVGYAVVRLPGSLISVFLRQVSFLPYLMPGLAFAAAFLSLFAVSRGPIPALYGSLSLLILVMVVTYLPYASRSGISAMMQVGPEPEEAGMVLGAGFWRRIVSILAPLQKSALVIAIILPFITGMKELSLVVMLVTPGTELLTTQSIRFLDFGYTQLANATILIIGVVVMISVLVLNRMTKTNLATGLGG
ncbi:MAG: iron ABC transporter permease [Candidatus Marinimicrobia bacterium]|nr:iron ABC transporter permease [Candidatus Neomarinimicrobiota bacterium]